MCIDDKPSHQSRAPFSLLLASVLRPKWKRERTWTYERFWCSVRGGKGGLRLSAGWCHADQPAHVTIHKGEGVERGLKAGTYVSGVVLGDVKEASRDELEGPSPALEVDDECIGRPAAASSWTNSHIAACAPLWAS